MTGMAKKIKPKSYSTPDDEMQFLISEPKVSYNYKSASKMPAVAEFPYKKFEKIAALVPFTQKEWAHILQLSEKTLQRYSKDNKNFEGLYVDRILHIEQLIKMGLETFAGVEALYRWLKREKNVLGTRLTFESLSTTQGIQNIIDELGRIQHGVYI